MPDGEVLVSLCCVSSNGGGGSGENTSPPIKTQDGEVLVVQDRSVSYFEQGSQSGVVEAGKSSDMKNVSHWNILFVFKGRS